MYQESTPEVCAAQTKFKSDAKCVTFSDENTGATLKVVLRTLPLARPAMHG